MDKSSNTWEQQLERIGALWFHDGNPDRPHPLLTSGKHSSGFCNCGKLMEDPRLLSAACANLVEQLASDTYPEVLPIRRVVGPAMGAVTLAHEIALNISIRLEQQCLCAYAEKDSDDPSVMTLARTTLEPGERVLVAEDVLTTGGSIERTVAAVERAGGIVVPQILVLVNRSGLSRVAGRPVLALVDKIIPSWEPEECPLCKQGSEAIRPKGAESWARLKADY